MRVFAASMFAAACLMAAGGRSAEALEVHVDMTPMEVCLLTPMQADEAGPWYLGVSSGAAGGSVLGMNGHNFDTTRYPDWDYAGFPADKPEGYRWSYDLESGVGLGLELAVGRKLYSEGGGARIELAASRSMQNLDQIFNSLTYLDDSAIAELDNGVDGIFISTIGNLTNSSASLNAYYDLPVSDGVCVYAGVGGGVSLVDISDLDFTVVYVDRNEPRDFTQQELDRFNGAQSEDYSETALSGSAFLGVDYRLAYNVLGGLKFSYTATQAVEGEGEYLYHPVEGLTNVNEFSNIQRWSLTASVKYSL